MTLARTMTAIGCLTLAPTLASAAHVSTYTSVIEQLNNSGVSGNANLVLDSTANTLAFDMMLSGLEPNQSHIQHIHGAFNGDGSVKQSVKPTLADDTDGDGIIELLEAFPRYGPILIPLADPLTGEFELTTDGDLSVSYLYDLTSSDIFASNVLTEEEGDVFDMADVLPLNMREIIIHGLSLDEGQGFGEGEADGTAGYKPALPVAYGRIVPAPVPLPAAGWLLGFGVVGLAGLRRRRRAAQA